MKSSGYRRRTTSRFGPCRPGRSPVIARIESHKSGRWWGYWFTKHTPEGTLKEVPTDDVVALENDDDACRSFLVD
jgi:hypothetical protein